MLFTVFACAIIAIGTPFSGGATGQIQNTIEGRVTSPEHRPIENVRVLLQNDSYSQLRMTYTDATGRFQFQGIASAIYYIQVEPGELDYERQSQRVEAISFNRRRSPSGAPGGEIFRVDFVLKPLASTKQTGDGAVTGPKAIVFYQEVPPAAKKEYERGVKGLEKGAFESAASSLKQAIEIFPDYYSALELLGTEYVKRGQHEPALSLLLHAVDVNKDGWRAFYSLGIAQCSLNQWSEGTKTLRRAVELNPDSPNVNMRLAIALARNEQSRGEAIETLEKVTRLAKESVPQAFFYLGILYAQNSRFREAADALQTFLRLYPQAGEKDKIQMKIAEYRQKASAQGNK
jgi:tetratricopeptide (TPR) repeat protein